MAAKQLKYEADARQSILAGVQKLSRAVVTTMGPSGRNVIIDKKFGSPLITKDGVTVAKEIELQDPFEKSPARRTTSPATAPRRLPCLPRRSTAKGSRTSRPAPTR